MTVLPTADAILSRIQRTITRHELLIPGESVLLAVSGGVDSVVMLYGLQRLGYEIEVAHFDHRTRHGASSDDASFVQELCRGMNISCHMKTEAVEQGAREAGKSFEGYARERRYDFLFKTAAERGIRTIATAHHEDDQAETMIMGVLGMTSGFGLTGIAPVYEQGKIRVIRPLLDCARSSIEAWAKCHDITWREDHTNAEACCTRNRVRLELLPSLQAYSPNANRALARLADIMRTDSTYLDALACDKIEAWKSENKGADHVLDRDAFLEMPEALQRRVLKLLARRINLNLSYERTVTAVQYLRDGASGKYFDLGNNVSLYSIGKKIFFCPAHEEALDMPLFSIALNVPGETPLPDGVLQSCFLTESPMLPDGIRDRCSPTRQYFDADKLSGKLQVRFRKPGDRMVPFGMTHARKIQNIMVDLHIPAFQRDRIPLLLMGGEILWIAGYTRSHWATVDDTTTTLLEIELRYRA